MSLNIELPKFNHPEVSVFYEQDLSIPKEKVAAILELPRATLIEDMETILLDTIERKEFFKNYPDKDKWWATPKHALWVLTELKAEEAFPSILKILYQEDDYNDVYFGDFATEQFWEVIYHLGGNQLEALKKRVLASGGWLNRGLPSATAEQIALHQPARRSEIIDWYRSILDTFLAMEDGDPALDGEITSWLVIDLIHIQAAELLPQIKALSERGLVYDGFAGDMKSIEKDIVKPVPFSRKRKLKTSIFERYEDAMQWHGYRMKYDEAYKEKNTYKPKDTDSSSYRSSKPVGTIKREGKKVGRNEPCPCGSGKKYKKCCLNN